MDFKKWLLTAFGTLALAISVFGVPAQATKARCTTEECACEQALQQNTVEALEEFLKEYPQSTTGGESACAALAVPPPDEASTLDNEDNIEDRTTAQPERSPYGG